VTFHHAPGTPFGKWKESFDRIAGTVPGRVRVINVSAGAGGVTVDSNTEP
jgi:hypothetical protein